MSEKHISEGRRKRTEEIERLRQVFSRVEGGVLADFVGLKVKEVDELRRRFRQAGGEMKVLKNNLTRLAVENTPLKSLDRHLIGPTSVAFGFSDVVAVAKVATEFAKDHEALKIKGGFLKNQVLDRQQVIELSQLGGREEVRGRLLGALNAPAQHLLGVLNAVPQKFMGVLKAKAEQMEGAKN